MTNFTLKGLIYGQPGIGKSTIALSAPKPFFIDIENGLKRVNPEYKVLAGNMVVYATDDTKDIKKQPYQQILDLFNSDKLDKYDTIIIDTVGRLVDRINDWLAVGNPKQKKGDGSPALQGYGAIKNQFSNFLRLVETKGKSVIFIAHEKEDKNDDKVFKRPDIMGSSGKDLVKDLDFIGYMSKIGNKAVIDFNPSETYYAKNSAGLSDYLEFPRIKGLNNFLATNLFNVAKEKALEDADLSFKFSTLIGNISEEVNKLENLEQINAYFQNEYQKHDKIWSSFEVERQLFADKVKDLGLNFDPKAKVFLEPNAKPEPKAVDNTIEG